MQEQVVEPRIPLFVIDKIGIAAERVAFGQSRKDGAGRRQPRLGRHAPRQCPERLLQRIDARPAIGRVDHQTHAAFGRQRGGQRVEPGLRIGKMMKDAATVDIVEPPMIGRIQKAAGGEGDAAKAANLRPFLGDPARGARQVEIGDLIALARRCQNRRQLDQCIPGAAPGGQDPEGLRPVPRAPPQEMIHLKRMGR